MSFQQIRSALESVVAITVSPFDAAGALDEAAYTAVVERLVAGGVQAITPNGNTSEFYALSERERERAVHLTLRAAGDRATVIAGVGYDVGQAVAAARSAADAGAHAVMVHQPVHPYQSADGWVDYHREIARAVPQLGVICYVRNPRLGPATFAALADNCPNLVGVKYAVPDPVALPDLIAAVGPARLVWVCGLAETWAPYFWVSGARGFTSGLANVAPAESLALLTALRANDFGAAMGIWARLRPFEDLRARDAAAANVSVVKEALSQLGLCRPDVRPPISRLDPADSAAVSKILGELRTALA